LILSLGECREEDLPPDARQALIPMLHEQYRTADDPGLHAAAEWLLRVWGQQAWLDRELEGWAADPAGRAKRLRAVGASLAKGRDQPPPQWYVNGQGQTMVVVPGPAEFVMGSPPTEADRFPGERQHARRIGRTFALAACPVTKEQYLRFHPDFAHDQMHRYPERTCPIGRMSWYEAAKYCNWLSEQEGIARDQWCYETDPQGRVTGLKENHLSRTGYRLPTEAEVEYACRAGAVTSRYYGETEELLPKYGWYHPNGDSHTWPVGVKKPNDLGLFDTLGNVMTWCQDAYNEYPAATPPRPVEDGDGELTMDPKRSRMARGGSFPNRAPAIRSAFRTWFDPSQSLYNVGIRPARTLAP
jgi:formylglycine-generating enzyme required for sulfatase activity